MIVIKEPQPQELDEMYLLRWEINRKPFGLPKGTEVDEHKASSYKVIALDDTTNKIVGSARLIVREDNVGEVNFVGVHESYRSQGIGERLMEYLHEKAKSLGVKKILVDARKTAEKFYQKLGYESLEETFAGPPYNQQEVSMVIKFI